MNGSVRIKTVDLELPQLLMQSSSTSGAPATATTSSNHQQSHGNAIDSETGRAVDNQYSFV